MSATGMMWVDDTPRPLEEILEEALGYYRRKYGEPTRCTVHPALLDSKKTISGIEVEPASSLLPSHLWIFGAHDE